MSVVMRMDAGPERSLSRPVGPSEFASRMEAFVPYERKPRLAVGLSGGADSTALAVLAGEWARDRGGEVVALVVDHGLRSESAAEARSVATWCARRGIPADVLVWRGPKPRTGIEAAARDARQALLGEAAARHGALHLLLAHHAGDQAETIAMRRGKGSGPLGLAGMSACIERPGYRVLRPLLDLAKERLTATLACRGEAWIDDPMNRDLRFARARMRAAGVPAQPVRGRAAWRVMLEGELAASLPAVVSVDRWGVGTLDRQAWARLPRGIARLAVARIAQTVGGRDYPPRSDRLDGLVSGLLADGPVAATLGRCLWRGRDTVTILREVRHLPVVEASGVPREVLWDGRFRVGLPAGAWTLRACGTVPDAASTDRREEERRAPVPLRVAATLPVVVGPEGGLAAVPHLGWARDGAAGSCRSRFAPGRPLVGPSFAPPPGSGMLAGRSPYDGRASGTARTP